MIGVYISQKVPPSVWSNNYQGRKWRNNHSHLWIFHGSDLVFVTIKIYLWIRFVFITIKIPVEFAGFCLNRVLSFSMDYIYMRRFWNWDVWVTQRFRGWANVTSNILYGMVECGSDRGHLRDFEIIEIQESHELFAYSELEELFRKLSSMN